MITATANPINALIPNASSKVAKLKGRILFLLYVMID
jgi:hypothetical protein